MVRPSDAFTFDLAELFQHEVLAADDGPDADAPDAPDAPDAGLKVLLAAFHHLNRCLEVSLALLWEADEPLPPSGR